VPLCHGNPDPTDLHLLIAPARPPRVTRSTGDGAPAYSGDIVTTTGTTTPGPAERPRAHPRLELDVYVDYTGSEVLLFHKVQNISLGGICIQSEGVEDVGTVVDLVLNFPDLDASLAVQGEVVWANRERPMDMGIRYTDLDNERRDTLRKYMTLVQAKKNDG